MQVIFYRDHEPFDSIAGSVCRGNLEDWPKKAWFANIELALALYYG